jgi:hypothetical protein
LVIAALRTGAVFFVADVVLVLLAAAGFLAAGVFDFDAALGLDPAVAAALLRVVVVAMARSS